VSLSANPFDREDRAATNQTLFREFNEQLNALKERGGFVVPVEWICECANDTCVQTIEMSAHEYEAVHRRAERFSVNASKEHVWPDRERVIERNNRYWVVEKIGRPTR
jgi:hypothetical protein